MYKHHQINYEVGHGDVGSNSNLVRVEMVQLAETGVSAVACTLKGGWGIHVETTAY